MDGESDPVNGPVKADAGGAANRGHAGRAVDRTLPSDELRTVEIDGNSAVPPRSALLLFIGERLEQHPHFRGRASLVRVELVEETIVLSGRLPSHYLKQVLQEAVRLISYAAPIDNRVEVMRPNHY